MEKYIASCQLSWRLLRKLSLVTTYLGDLSHVTPDDVIVWNIVLLLFAQEKDLNFRSKYTRGSRKERIVRVCIAVSFQIYFRIESSILSQSISQSVNQLISQLLWRRYRNAEGVRRWRAKSKAN